MGCYTTRKDSLVVVTRQEGSNVSYLVPDEDIFIDMHFKDVTVYRGTDERSCMIRIQGMYGIGTHGYGRMDTLKT